jgi:hypothetical protein
MILLPQPPVLKLQMSNTIIPSMFVNRGPYNEVPLNYFGYSDANMCDRLERSKTGGRETTNQEPN